MSIVAEEKRRLRAALKTRRAQITPAAAAAAALAIRDRLMRETAPEPDAVVTGYWPMGDELDIRPTLEAFHARGRAIGLPVVQGRLRPLVFRSWEPGDALVPGGFGTSIPAPECEEVEPGLLLVPLLGFDRRGYRLGYGGGFYDMTIEALRRRGHGVIAVGVAFAAQEVEAVPVEDFDQRLDAIVTEAETFSFIEVHS